MWVGVGGFSKVVATFSHVGRSFNLFMATTRGIWLIPSFRILGYVLYVEHMSCIITNCSHHQWPIPSLFSIGLKVLLEENITIKLLSLSLELFFKILLFQVFTFVIFVYINIFSHTYFMLVCFCSMWLCFSQGCTVKSLISGTKSQNLNNSPLFLHLSLPNILKPCVK